jgi:hypothetical protein
MFEGTEYLRGDRNAVRNLTGQSAIAPGFETDAPRIQNRGMTMIILSMG